MEVPVLYTVIVAIQLTLYIIIMVVENGKKREA